MATDGMGRKEQVVIAAKHPLGSQMLKYFAYGSNMSSKRLQQRVPSAIPLGCYRLEGHDLRYHKVGDDGSGKGDAFYTGQSSDFIYGVLYDVDPDEKKGLDRIEGLGFGYEEKVITLNCTQNGTIEAVTYYATKIDSSILPYSWYLNHIIQGALEMRLPEEYFLEKIKFVQSIEDDDLRRARRELDIHQ